MRRMRRRISLRMFRKSKSRRRRGRRSCLTSCASIRARRFRRRCRASVVRSRWGMGWGVCCGGFWPSYFRSHSVRVLGAELMVGGRGQCWVAAAYVSAGCMLAKFFITFSHCPWRDFISWSFGDKETKQRKRLSTICIKCPQRADHCFWFPRRTVLAKPRTAETLLLANSYIPTLRHQCSRASSMDCGPIRPYASYALAGCAIRGHN